MLNKLVRYYRDCYLHDHVSQSISDISKISNIHMINDMSLLSGLYPDIPLPVKYGENLIKELQLSGESKNLNLFAFIHTSESTILGKTKTRRTPMLSIPCEISKKDDDYFITPDYAAVKMNDLPNVDYRELIPMLTALEDRIDFSTCSALHNVFKKSDRLSKIDSDELLLFPQVYETQARIKRLNATSVDKVVPAFFFGTIENSNYSNGILTDLEEISKKDLTGTAIDHYFSCSDKQNGNKSRAHELPVNLTATQKHLLENQNGYINNVVIGPPGTGKSFMIAALALNNMLAGKRTLITAHNAEALDAIQRIFDQVYGLDDLILVLSKEKKRRNASADKLRRKIRLANTQQVYPFDYSMDRLTSAAERLKEAEESYLSLAEMDLRHTDINLTGRGFIDKIKTKYYRFKRGEQISAEVLDDLLKLAAAKNHVSRTVIKAKHQYNYQSSGNAVARELSAFTKFINSNRSATHQQLIKSTSNWQSSKHLFPITLCKSKDVPDLIALKKEYDFVYIDEASQCNIASILPLIYRGESFTLFGDQKQLKHVTFISRVQEYQNLLNCELDASEHSKHAYREQSALDYSLNNIDYGKQVITLEDHFRCRPDIIGFSNRQFYDNQLIINTNLGSNLTGNLVFTKFDSIATNKKHNDVEIDYIIKQVKGIISQEKQQVRKTSLGVISPFRDQAERLLVRFKQEVPFEDMIAHELFIGTPFHFQGKERDEIFISLCAGDGDHHGRFTYLNNPNVMNVCITRAKNKQEIVHSFDPASLNHNSLLAAYFNYQKSVDHQAPSTHVDDSFIKEVRATCRAFGAKNVQTNHLIGGFNADVYLPGKKPILIDLIGYPGDFQDAFPIDRYYIYQHLGLQVFPISYTEWQEQQDVIKSRLHEAIATAQEEF